MNAQITIYHLQRPAYIYVRQSTLGQVHGLDHIYSANAKFWVSSPTGYFKVFRQQGAQVALVLTRVAEEICADFVKPVKSVK